MIFIDSSWEEGFAMGDINLSDYKNIYLQTAREYINSMFLNCEKLANNVSDKEAIKNLHIASHSLKSQSQVMGFKNVANICLGIEKRSNDALQGVSQLNNETILNIKKKAEKLGEMLKSSDFASDKRVQDDNDRALES